MKKEILTKGSTVLKLDGYYIIEGSGNDQKTLYVDEYTDVYDEDVEEVTDFTHFCHMIAISDLEHHAKEVDGLNHHFVYEEWEEMKIKYVVMVDIIAGDDTFSEEYTGNYYDSREEARKEFMKARQDVSVYSAYIEEKEI